MNDRRDSMTDRILASRANIPRGALQNKKAAEEGGCGVTGFISSIPVRGRHIYEPSIQMHNRGNGKGGGIAAVGLSAESLGVTQDILDSHYMLQVALLDPSGAARSGSRQHCPLHGGPQGRTASDRRRLP